MESPRNSHKAESVPPSAFSLSIHNCELLCKYTHAPVTYSDVTTNTTVSPCIGILYPCLVLMIAFMRTTHMGVASNEAEEAGASSLFCVRTHARIDDVL